MADSFHHGLAAAVSWRIAKILLVALLALLLSAGAATWWVTRSASGAQWLWNRVAAVVPGELSAGSIQGALSDGFVATAVRYRNDGLEVELTSAQLVLVPRIFPLAVRLDDVQIGDIVVRQRTAPVPAAEDSASLRSILSMLQLPIPVRIDTLTLDSLRVLSFSGEETFSMEAVSLAGELHESVAFDRARLRFGNIALEAAGRFGLAAPNAIDGVVDVRIEQEASEALSFNAILLGDLDELRVDVTSESLAGRLTGTVRQITGSPHWDLRLLSDRLQWPLVADEPIISGRSIDLRSSGALADYDLAGTAIADVQPIGELNLAIDARGNTGGIDVRDLQLDGEHLRASTSGRLNWSDFFAIAVDAEVARFDPLTFVPGWSEGRYVTGEVEAAWRSGSIDLTRLQLQVSDSSMLLAANGTVNIERGIVDLDIDWQNLQWPVGGDSLVQSESGRIRLDGHPDDWLVDGRLALEFPGYPPGDFQLQGTGDRQQVALTINESAVLGGTVAGQLQYDWHSGGEWFASLDASNLHTEPLAANWPGIFNARIDTRGQLQPLQVELNIERFDGSLRGMPVEGKGALQYRPGSLTFSAFRIASETAWLEVDGDLQSSEGIDFSVDVDALGTFQRDVTGALTASGNLVLQDEFPVLQMQLEGQDLAWREFRVGTLAVSSGESAADRPLDIQLDGGDVSVDGRTFQTVELRLEGGPDAQHFEARVTHEDVALHLALDGALEEWRSPLESAWIGELEALRLAAGDDVQLQLENPVPLRFSRDTQTIDDACLIGNGAVRICGNVNRNSTESLQANASFAAIPVEALQLVLDTGLSFTQTLDGTMSLSLAPGRGLSGNVSVDMAPGFIRHQTDSRLATATGPGRLRLQLDNGSLLSGEINMPFGEASTIDGTFDVLDVGLGDASRVEGNLNVEVANIGVVANVTPIFAAASGRLEAALGVTGTVGQPVFSGQGSIRDGSLSYEPLGLELTELQLRGDVRDRNRIELQGTFRAGEGRGELRTSGDYLAGDRTELQIFVSGQNLTVIDVPDVQVVANPDLQVGLRAGTLLINGKIVVPQARLSPTNLVSGGARESNDVVIVAGQDADVSEEPEDESAFAINGRVNLELGDDVVIDLDVADASVSGQATFEWKGPVLPAADGQYRVAGNIQAYGQLLQITEGIVNFPNVPADNPVLRIRAEREIFGNSQVRSAGIFITGTAKRPDVEIYTTPATNESRALTMLVTGSDFNFEQGVGAVDVGTYIAPKLYLSYGIGLFARENVISVRYDLARGFGIKASSGSRSDGVDLSYTIEN